MKSWHTLLFTIFLVLAFGTHGNAQVQTTLPDGVKKVKFLNYESCIELFNPNCRVVLGHHVGGRILAYETDGKNILYVDPDEKNWTPGDLEQTAKPSAGRFDIGPEVKLPRTGVIWNGSWTPKIVGKRKAQLTSQIDPEFQIQVTREFELDETTTRLNITQTVTNYGKREIQVSFWSRTFAIHGGIVVVPCNPELSLLPNWYYMSSSKYLINFKPEDPNISRIDNFLVIQGPPEKPKLGFDATRGWVGYQAPNDLLFVKRFPVDMQRKSGEPGWSHFSVFYPQSDKLPACEIEPIGPLELLQPGASESYSVQWELLANPFPKGGILDPHKIETLVRQPLDPAWIVPEGPKGR
ncbi:MAG: hypothetical protein AAF623_16985 [Planctomycetota bacterium]